MPPAGAVRVLSSQAAPSPGALRVALVQSGVPNAWARDPTRLRSVLAKLVALSRGAGEVDLVVWPENAFPVAVPANVSRLEAARRELPRVEHVLLGAPRFDRERPDRRYTSALLLDPAGRSRAHHDKQRLLPFTESWPTLLAPFDPGGTDLSPGAAPAPLRVGATKVGVLICYELLFADLASELVRDGAGLLVNLSNDSWFADSGGAEQQLAAAVLRAIELRRPLLRATTTGVTAALDPAGRVVARLPGREAAVLRIDVHSERDLSPYAELGDLIVASLLALFAASLAASAIARRG